MINLLNGSALYQVAAGFFNENDGHSEYHADENKIAARLKTALYLSTTSIPSFITNNVRPYETSLEIQNINESLPFITDPYISEPLELWQSLLIGFLLLLLILFCVIGNFFVIIAILTERDLRNRPQYILILSLAAADFIVGFIVTPLGAWSTLMQGWYLGIVLCDMWISIDVFVCTSSILHLVAIALDRLRSITNIYYVQNRTVTGVLWYIVFIWLISAIISFLPLLGWKDKNFANRVIEEHVCLVSQQISYQIFSTATAFYIPLCAIIIIYYKIYRAANKRFKRDRDRRTINRAFDDTAKNKAAPILTYNETTLSPTENGHYQCKVQYESCTINSISDDERTPIPLSENVTAMNVDAETMFINKFNGNFRRFFYITLLGKENPLGKRLSTRPQKRKKRVKESLETRRERKAWRTLAIITGTFVACWTPFFLISLYRPICGCKIPHILESVTSWLGYLNSALNPIIYTVFSMDFRMAFQRILKRICFIKNFN